MTIINTILTFDLNAVTIRKLYVSNIINDE